MPKNNMSIESLLKKEEYKKIVQELKKKKYTSTFDLRNNGIDLIPQRLNEKLNLMFEHGYIERIGKPRYFKYCLSNKYWIWELRNEVNEIISKYKNLVVR